MSVSHRVQLLKAELITPENFEPYGEVIFPSGDGQVFNGEDAQLNVQNGIPHFYIMRLHNK
jgi:ureidoglycolate hydrolase